MEFPGGKLELLKKFLVPGILLVGLVTVIGVKYAESSRTAITDDYLQGKFTHDPVVGGYTEAMPRVYGGGTKAPVGVLLLHGYSASPQEFDYLVGALRKANIPYYAPLITGFGLDDFRLLNAASPTDWKRDALNGYEIVAAMADKVSILGHSNGGALAAIVAKHRSVDKLVLTGPSVFVHPDDEGIKSMVLTPVLSDIALALIPVFVKPQREGRVTNTDTRDPEGAQNSFHYPALASKSLVTVWTIQDQVDLKDVSVEEFWLLHGADDLTVDMPSTVAALKTVGIKYRQRVFENSGHNILEDFDKDEAVDFILSILTGEVDSYD